MPKGDTSNFSHQSLTAYIAHIHAGFFFFFFLFFQLRIAGFKGLELVTVDSDELFEL